MPTTPTVPDMPTTPTAPAVPNMPIVSNTSQMITKTHILEQKEMFGNPFKFIYRYLLSKKTCIAPLQPIHDTYAHTHILERMHIFNRYFRFGFF